jgi:hypothetical protein
MLNQGRKRKHIVPRMLYKYQAAEYVCLSDNKFHEAVYNRKIFSKPTPYWDGEERYDREQIDRDLDALRGIFRTLKHDYDSQDSNTIPEFEP